MTDSCCCPPEAGNAVCDLPAQNVQPDDLQPHISRDMRACPVCGVRGKPVQGQTVKALLSVSLREVQQIEYLFCKTQACPVVYFSHDGAQTFTVEHIRECVYQKEPDNDEVFVCYCFRYTLGDFRTVVPGSHQAIVDDINRGINAGQCACDLRNPQGSCCLGNVRRLIQRIDAPNLQVSHESPDLKA